MSCARQLLTTAAVAALVTVGTQQVPAQEAHETSMRVLGIVEVPRALSLSADGTRPSLKSPLVLRRRPAADSPVAVTITSADSIDSAAYGYEQLGARVFGRYESWSLLKTTDGAAGWLAPAEAGVFHSLEALIADRLTYLTEAWDGRIRATPGAGTARRIRPAKAPDGDDTDVRVTGFRNRGGALWVNLEVLSHSLCESIKDPTVVARGWVPAHDAKGAPTVWFYSRGC